MARAIFYTHQTSDVCVACARIKWRRLGPYGDVHDSARVFIIIFCPRNGENRPEIGFFEFI